MSSIKVKNSTLVCPSEDTPKGSLWLSKLDMMIRTPYSHTNVFFLYSPSKSSSTLFDSNLLKESLSKALVPFYPMAGRLNFNEENGRYEIDCNAKGALFIEAESTQTVADLGDYLTPDSQLRKVVFPTCDYSGGLSSFPLLLVQVTRFSCGSVCLGFAQHHHVADGASHSHFINSWARLARGLDLSVYPVHDRAAYLSPRDPPKVNFRHLEYEPSLTSLLPKGLSDEMLETKECIFKLTKHQIDTLKQQATSQEVTGYKPSSFEVQAAHVWRSACMARGLADDQDVQLNIPVNGRRRLKGIPEGYCGNVVFLASCIEKAGDVTRNPLWYAASKIHKAIKKKDDIEHLRSAIDYVESHPNLTALVRGAHSDTCPNLGIVSWASFPLYEANFGWGGPQFFGINAIKFEGLTYLTSSSNGDGSFTVAIKLYTPHMKLFEKYLYNF